MGEGANAAWRPFWWLTGCKLQAGAVAERRKMMQAWADTCDALEAGAEVIQLHRNA